MRHTPPIRTGQARYLAAARSGPRRAGLGLARRALREHSRRPGHAAQKCAAARPRTHPLEAANRAHQDRARPSPGCYPCALGLCRLWARPPRPWRGGMNKRRFWMVLSAGPILDGPECRSSSATQMAIARQPGRVRPPYWAQMKALFTCFHMLCRLSQCCKYFLRY